MADIDIEDNVNTSRFIAAVGGSPAGFLAYELEGPVMTLTHTEVDPDHEGEGVGSALVRHALDGVRSKGARTTVRIRCPFVAKWVQAHPEYQSLLEV